MPYKFIFNNECDEKDACGTVSELIGAVGLFYIVLLFLGFILVRLETPELSHELSDFARPAQVRTQGFLIP